MLNTFNDSLISLITNKRRSLLLNSNTFTKVACSFEKHLIVVGAGHIIGQDGLIEKLKTKGYTITRLE
ncbi:TraB/GumN family protein [Clostridium fungisolvens]|uniref:TraB/GumN family protein n=1 Tax=Clostridium fungisolvens TaxID=1604897 RepID=UPI0016187355